MADFGMKYLPPMPPGASKELQDAYNKINEVLVYTQERLKLSNQEINNTAKTVESNVRNPLGGNIIEFTSVAGGTNATKVHGVSSPRGAIVIKNNAFNESSTMMVWELTATEVTVRNGDPFLATHDITVWVF